MAFVNKRDGDEGVWHELEEIKKGRKSQMAFAFVSMNYYPLVGLVGEGTGRMTKELVSSLFTVSDEAFVIHALENNWDYWLAWAEHR